MFLLQKYPVHSSVEGVSRVNSVRKLVRFGAGLFKYNIVHVEAGSGDLLSNEFKIRCFVVVIVISVLLARSDWVNIVNKLIR